MKRKSLSLVLVLAMVLLMSFGIVAHAETTTGNAKDILLTDGERTFEEDTVMFWKKDCIVSISRLHR